MVMVPLSFTSTWPSMMSTWSVPPGARVSNPSRVHVRVAVDDVSTVVGHADTAHDHDAVGVAVGGRDVGAEQYEQGVGQVVGGGDGGALVDVDSAVDDVDSVEAVWALQYDVGQVVGGGDGAALVHVHQAVDDVDRGVGRYRRGRPGGCQ